MAHDLAIIEEKLPTLEQTVQLSTFEIDGQLIGIPVLEVQDILNPMAITKIPLARKEIAGLLNLRGRIVTAIDMRERFGLEAFENPAKQMSTVVEKDEELYSLLVDRVGDVINLPQSKHEPNPANLDNLWSEASNGIYRLEDRILIMLNVEKLLGYQEENDNL